MGMEESYEGYEFLEVHVSQVREQCDLIEEGGGRVIWVDDEDNASKGDVVVTAKYISTLDLFMAADLTKRPGGRSMLSG